MEEPAAITCADDATVLDHVKRRSLHEIPVDVAATVVARIIGRRNQADLAVAAFSSAL